MNGGQDSRAHNSKTSVRNNFKAPEGKYKLDQDRKHNLVQFHYQRCTRLCLAKLKYGVPEDGLYVVFNVGELVHCARWNAIDEEPLRSLALCNTAVRALPTCIDFQAGKADGVDLLVGIADGTVQLLSLRAQLASPPNSKPIVAATLTPETGQDAKCIAVLWLPKSDGMFVTGFASGTVHVYKKSSILGEGAGRFSLGLGSNGKSTSPHSTITISGRGVHDLSASPCGTRLAAACYDGALRIVDVATGTVIGGFQSYYGALLCCSFSPDGKFVAAAGEDDLVAVYSIAERYPIAHCQGHDSWVSRVQWDPWLQLGGPGAASGEASGGGPLSAPDLGSVYRLASVGQDAQLCLWDIQTAPNEGELFATPVHGLSMRKSASNHLLNSSMTLSRGNDSGSTPGHQRKPSMSKPSIIGGGITASLPRADMNMVQPSMQHRVHNEPMSDVIFTASHIITADHSGCIRSWARPTGAEQKNMTCATESVTESVCHDK